jgi:ornithine carbamoyltransferase
MNPKSLSPLVIAEALSPSDRAAPVASARALQQAAQAGAVPKALDGKNIGLLCEAPRDAEARLFEHAAGELGARVARISPGLSASSPREEIRRTARLLGQLYDAIECQGSAPELVAQLRAEAGVPVFDGVAEARHPTAAWAADLGGTDDARRLLLQALLIAIVA